MSFSRVGRLVRLGVSIQRTLNVPRAVSCAKVRHASSAETVFQERDQSLLVKLTKKLPFLNVHKTRITAAGYLLYEEIVDQLDYVEMFEKYQLPDTFYSWFVLTELHIWLLSVRGMAEGEDGKCIRSGLLQALWADVAIRIKELGAGTSTELKEQVNVLSEQLQASLIAYDEGLQSDDIVLAGALWRRLYHHEYVAPEHLNNLVKYVRKQLVILDNTSTYNLVVKKCVKWEAPKL